MAKDITSWTEKVKTVIGFPPFEWWSYPPPILLDVFIYNITNKERFLSGEDPKMIVEEVGPILYKEIWTHTDVVFNDNSTMTYLVNRTLEYMEENTIDLNATLIVPNLATLAVASRLWDASIFTKMTVNALFRILKKEHLIHTTVYNFLYNNTDSFLDALHKTLPNLVPVRNVGIVPLMYKDYFDNVTAFIGTAHGNELFSLIDRYRNSDNIPGHPDRCKTKITNATEGIIYNQMIRKDSVLKYYRKCICKTTSLYYEGEHTLYGLKTYKFEMAPSDLNRTYPPEEDCFDTKPSLPNGTADVSKCTFCKHYRIESETIRLTRLNNTFSAYPVTTSFVYFNHTDDSLNTCAEIKIPNGKTAPPSEAYLEPITGIPLKSSAALQANLNVKPLQGFDKSFKRFSGQQIPLCYLHYHSDGLPLKVFCLIYLMKALPAIGWMLTVLSLSFGLYCIWESVRRKQRTQNSESIKDANVELETFLKQPVIN
ncbi:scavenger receptor class b type-1 sr-b1 [Holotrichia oblita]|uniref:Scavenger receptor class b type-1 sr-b1 n=1 Tax=Holotrichia oblita TaxID=644536 RepID=A0ACB9SIP4_HOLOL|nr:scavenger receptor class b type-1 sr-b1 [Holotrichia oblita]